MYFVWWIKIFISCHAKDQQETTILSYLHWNSCVRQTHQSPPAVLTMYTYNTRLSFWRILKKLHCRENAQSADFLSHPRPDDMLASFWHRLGERNLFVFFSIFWNYKLWHAKSENTCFWCWRHFIGSTLLVLARQNGVHCVIDPMCCLLNSCTLKRFLVFGQLILW